MAATITVVKEGANENAMCCAGLVLKLRKKLGKDFSSKAVVWKMLILASLWEMTTIWDREN